MYTERSSASTKLFGRLVHNAHNFIHSFIRVLVVDGVCPPLPILPIANYGYLERCLLSKLLRVRARRARKPPFSSRSSRICSPGLVKEQISS